MSDHWIVAVKYEHPIQPEDIRRWPGFLSLWRKRHPEGGFLEWVSGSFSTREEADRQLNIIREIVKEECICGRCPIVRDVRLIHAQEEEVEVGLPAKKQEKGISDDLKRALGFDA